MGRAVQRRKFAGKERHMGRSVQDFQRKEQSEIVPRWLIWGLEETKIGGHFVGRAGSCARRVGGFRRTLEDIFLSKFKT